MGTLSDLLEKQQQALLRAADCARLLESQVSALAVHRAAARTGRTADLVEVHDPARAHELLDAAIALARDEIRLIQPSATARHLVIDRLGGDWRGPGPRVAVRTIHQSGLLENATAVAQLERLSRRGVQIRVAPLLPFRLVVVDETALVCLPDSTLLVRQPALVQLLGRVFEYCWDDARDLRTAPAAEDGPCAEPRPAGPPAPVGLTEQQLVILRLWAKGRQDHEIARELHVSPRTLRRMVSVLLRRLGVGSRFEAGVIAARTHRLLPDQEPVAPQV